MNSPQRLRILPLLIWLALCPHDLRAAAPTSANHLFGSERTGYTEDEIIPPYHLVWSYVPLQAPDRAWAEPSWEVQRIDFDYAYALASDGAMVFYASSSDHSVCALDLATGETRWRFFTEGPVRLAPTVDGDRLFFSSDDGHVYCLACYSGNLLWKYRPEIPDRRLIGNDCVIARHPARSGVLVEGDRAYATFGMLSAEGIVVACFDKRSGEVLWQNETSGTRYETQPHFEAMGGVSPQGYLALAGEVLVVPCGRGAPALFRADDGELIYHEAEGLFPGGAWTMTHGDLVFTPCEYLKKPNPELPGASEAAISPEATLVALRAATGEEVFHLQGALRGVISPDGRLSLIGKDKLLGVALDEVLRRAPESYQAKLGSSEGHFVDAARCGLWETPADRVYELIQAGSILIAGQRDSFACYHAANGNLLWQTDVRGDVHELLVADGALLVSTSTGEIRCYRPGRERTTLWAHQPSTPTRTTPEALDTAAEILETADKRQGYSLLLGRPDPELWTALAKQSELTWTVLSEGAKLDEVRHRLAASGLYGSRIAIHRQKSATLPYADYMASLVLARVESAEDLARTSESEIYRVTRPHGGVALVTCPETLRGEVEAWLDDTADHPESWQRVELGYCLRRGPLQGEGAWTHQYADVGKTSASQEQRVSLPLETLWFGGLGPADAVSRHYRTPAPLAVEGRLFVTGNTTLHAVDAYTGRVLWQQEMPGVARWPAGHRGGSAAVDTRCVYVPRGMKCMALDQATGRLVRTYHAPPISSEAVPEVVTKKQGAPGSSNAPGWEYLAVTDDLVLGAVARPNLLRSWWSQARPECVVLFALDKNTGKTQWQYSPRLPVSATGIAVSDDKVLLVEGPAEIVSKQARRGILRDTALPEETPRSLVALELGTGEMLWRSEEIGPSQDALCAAQGVVLATIPENHGSTGNLNSVGARLSAFATDDGSLLWSADKLQSHIPLIVDGVAYLGSAAVDLRTGEPILRPDAITGEPIPVRLNPGGGCGVYAGCPNVLMKRSGSMGFVDIEKQGGLYHFPNMRASCWINMIPACGVVLVPEGSSSCPCAYNYKASLALVSARRHNHWGLAYASRWPKSGPVESLRLNFAAPGDKPDQDGEIWYAIPRPSTEGPRGAGGMGVPYRDNPPVELRTPPTQRRTVGRNPDWMTVEGSDRPWIHGCTWVGPLDLKVELSSREIPSRRWKVTLYFHEGREPVSHFDIRLQGKTVRKNMRLANSPDGEPRAVPETFAVEASQGLEVQLVPRGDTMPRLDAMTIDAQ